MVKQANMTQSSTLIKDNCVHCGKPIDKITIQRQAEEDKEDEDFIDGPRTGGRADAESETDLESHLYCDGFCCIELCVPDIGEKCGQKLECNRCWCCFNQASSCVGKFTEEKYEKEEWLRDYSCWPLPLVTIISVSIELYFFISFSSGENYSKQLINSEYLWTAEHKSEWHRWFTYSFLHSGSRHLFFNLTIQIILGLFVEFEHKWVRMAFIYSIGVASGALMHSVMDPVRSLCGASGGIYAIIGAAIMKSKRRKKYRGRLRRWFNNILSLLILILFASDITLAVKSYFECDPTVLGISVWAHVGGLISGLCVSYIVMNKFQEAVGQEVFRKTGKHTNITYQDVKCCNCFNFKTAYLFNPDVLKLLKDFIFYFCIIILAVMWGYCIYFNLNADLSTLNDNRC